MRTLAIPFEWQDAVIRAAITLKLNAFDDTGAIIAAMTTSIPEAPNSGRNWDYRYCWLRDGYFVVDALNRLGATRTMERYLRYIVDIAASADDGALQPVYRINGDAALVESSMSRTLPGYRGMGPVRIGNDAYGQVQHDVYGSAILAATHVFFDERLSGRGDDALFERLEALGERAVALLRPARRRASGSSAARARVHTFSSVMCWAACDRLARIAARLGLHGARGSIGAPTPARMHAYHRKRCWNDERSALRRRRWTATRSTRACCGCTTSASSPPTTRASSARWRAIERELKRGDFIFRYVEQDDFGAPENAFVVCTFWYVNALAALGRATRRATLFEHAARVPQPPRPARRAPRPADAASCGATSCRPTAWSASSTPRSGCRAVGSGLLSTGP